MAWKKYSVFWIITCSTQFCCWLSIERILKSYMFGVYTGKKKFEWVRPGIILCGWLGLQHQLTNGGGDFFHACEHFGRMFDNSFPACASFFLSFKVEISSHTLIPLFRPGSVHSVSASGGGCDQVFPDKFHVSSLPDRFPHCDWTAA